MIEDAGGKALDQLLTKIRPNIRYKTDRKGLDGAGIIDKLTKSGVAGCPYHVDFKKGIELLKVPDLFKTPNKQEIVDMKEQVKYYKEQYNKAKANGYKGFYTSYAK